MSKHAETAVWQSKDGTWNAGFYKRVSRRTSFEDPSDYDPEWNDDYDYETFEALGTNGTSPGDVLQHMMMPNPGMYSPVPYNKDNAGEIAKYEQLAQDFHDPEGAAKRKEKAEADARKESLLSQVMPVPGEDVTIHEGPLSYEGKLERGADGSLTVARIGFRSGKVERFVLLTPTGRVPAGNKVSKVEKRYTLPSLGYGGRPRPAADAPSKCMAPTPKGPCQRPTLSQRCWQHTH